VSGSKLSFGSDGPPGAYDDFAEADVILLVGANIADNHPLLAPRILDNTDAQVIVVDPRVTKTAMLATQHLAVRPRSDVTLLNGIIKLLLDEGLVDRDRVRRGARESAGPDCRPTPPPPGAPTSRRWRARPAAARRSPGRRAALAGARAGEHPAVPRPEVSRSPPGRSSWRPLLSPAAGVCRARQGGGAAGLGC